MKYIAAYHLLTIGGNDAPTAADIIALLATVGIEAESERVETVVARLAGKDIDELISEGTSKLASIPSDDAAVAGAHTPAGAPAEEKVEVKEGDDCDDCGDDDMIFDLFD
ncbi:60S acidic ribosomal protein P2 [Podila clonocystis]|nr:60S acidic ribosomal protein P2 [Podila clonocystis]